MLQSDTPLQSKIDDRLGYGPFSEAIADAIIAIKPQSGIVLGIQAAWGMGKTSAVNFVLEAIKAKNTSDYKRIIVKNFNPWLFSGMETLARGYPAELGRLIAETVDQDTSFSTRRVIENLIRGGGEMLGGAAALGAIALSGGTAIPFAGAIKSGITGAAKLGSYALEKSFS